MPFWHVCHVRERESVEESSTHARAHGRESDRDKGRGRKIEQEKKADRMVCIRKPGNAKLGVANGIWNQRHCHTQSGCNSQVRVWCMFFCLNAGRQVGKRALLGRYVCKLSPLVIKETVIELMHPLCAVLCF